MEAVERAYFVQSDQVTSGRAGPAELSSAATVWRGRAVSQRLNTEFLISAAEFIDISAARVRIF